MCITTLRQSHVTITSKNISALFDKHGAASTGKRDSDGQKSQTIKQTDDAPSSLPCCSTKWWGTETKQLASGTSDFLAKRERSQMQTVSGLTHV